MVATQLEVDAATAESAESALGTFFSCVAMSVDPASFRAIKETEPEVERWVGKTIVGGGRTGEMLILAGPRALARNLGAAGFSQDTSRRFIELVLDDMESRLPPEVYSKVETIRATASVT